MNDAQVILADEPTGALDSRSGTEVMALLKEIHTSGRTVILITHDEQVAAHAHRIIKLQDGEVISDTGRADEAPWSIGSDEMPLKKSRTHGRIPQIMELIKIALRALRQTCFVRH